MHTLPLATTSTVLLMAASGVATAQSLFLDLNTSPPFTPSSNPERLVHLNSRTYFSAVDHAGQEPWITDGTPAGTFRIQDIGQGVGSSVPDGFTALPDGRVIFAAYDFADREPWVTDGTGAGTSRILDVSPGIVPSHPGPFVAFAGKVYFLANDGVHGRELWQTDGTAAGTTLVNDLFAPASPQIPVIQEMRVSGGFLYYGINIVGQGLQLVKSDGTAAGTSLVKTLSLDVGGLVDQMLDLNGILLFRAKHPTLGSELWRSDGTAGGTFVVKDIATGGIGSSPSGMFRLGNHVIFAAYDPTIGRELFITDGTPTGTGLLADVNATVSPFSNSSDPIGLGIVGSRLVFSAYQPTVGRELFATDGTTAGTSRIADLWSGSSWSSPSGGAMLNGKLLFAANDGITGIELWETDGTTAGTQRISDILPGFDGFPIEQLTSAGNVVLFTKNDGFHGKELCVSDGTPAGTGLLADLFPGALSAGSDPTELTRIGERLYFVASPSANGAELFSTDGSVAGTQSLLSSATDPSISSFARLTPLGTGMFFFGASPTNGLAPYFTDGTTAGTVKLADTLNCFVSDIAIIGDEVVFQAIEGVTFDVFQYVSDGTVAGTHKLTGFTTSLGASSLEALGDQVLFVASTPETGFELFVTDGTNAGTAPLKDVFPGPDDSLIFEMVRAGSQAFFRADDGVHGYEFWVTDGTTAGTHLVADLEPGPGALSTFSIAPLGDRIVFLTVDSASQQRLWVSDGAVAGTFPIVTIPSNQAFSLGPMGNDDVLLFSTMESNGATHLWRTDGTIAGTFEVPGTNAPQFQQLITDVGTDRELVVTLSNPTTGLELHHTENGSSAPQLVADLAAGYLSSAPTDIERLGNRVFISADDGIHGRELHVLPLLAFDAFVAETFGSGCAPTSTPTPTIGVLGDAIASAPFVIEATALPPSAPSLVLFGVDSAALSIGFGCTLYVAPPFFSFATATNGSGALQVPVPSNPALLGLHAYLQFLASGTGGALHATPGLELVIGN